MFFVGLALAYIAGASSMLFAVALAQAAGRSDLSLEEMKILQGSSDRTESLLGNADGDPSTHRTGSP